MEQELTSYTNELLRLMGIEKQSEVSIGKMIFPRGSVELDDPDFYRIKLRKNVAKNPEKAKDVIAHECAHAYVKEKMPEQHKIMQRLGKPFYFVHNKLGEIAAFSAPYIGIYASFYLFSVANQKILGSALLAGSAFYLMGALESEKMVDQIGHQYARELERTKLQETRDVCKP